jgi:hypothetical protein
LVTDVLGQCTSSLFKGQALQEFLDGLTLEDGSNILPLSIGNPLPACTVQHSERVKLSNTPWQIVDSCNVTTKGRYIQANCNRALIHCGSKTSSTLFISKSGITHTFHTHILFYLRLVLFYAFLFSCLQLKLSQNMTVG